MPDNIMGGDNSVDFNVALRLTNIEASNQNIDSLIQRTEEWKRSIEAVSTSLSSTYELLQGVGSSAGNYVSAFESLVSLSERHESVLRRTLDTAQQLAGLSRDLEGLMSGSGALTNLIPGALAGSEVGTMPSALFGAGMGSPTFGGITPSMMPGAAPGVSFAGRGPGRLSQLVQGILGEGAQFEAFTSLGYMPNGMPGFHHEEPHTGRIVPGSTISTSAALPVPYAGYPIGDPFDEFGGVTPVTNTGSSSILSSILGLNGIPGAPGALEERMAKRLGLGTQRGRYSEAERLAGQFFMLPYFMPGGKLAYGLRHIDKLLGARSEVGPITAFLRKRKRLFGEYTEKEDADYLADRESFLDQLMEQDQRERERRGLEPLSDREVSNLKARYSLFSDEQLNSMNLNRALAPLSAYRLVKSGLLGREGSLVKGAQSFAERMVVRAPVSAEAAAAGEVGEIAGLSAAGVATGVTSVAALAAILGYKAVSGVAQGLRDYRGVAGDMSNGEALGRVVGTKAGSFYDSLLTFGTLDSKTAEEIRMGAEEAGLRYGGRYYNKYVSGAEGMYKKYGMSPDEYMSLFQDTVVKTGNSIEGLNANINTLGKIAGSSNTSFKQLLTNYQQYSQILAQGGFYGGAASTIATAAASLYSGNLMMAGAGSAAMMLGNQQGQMLAMMGAGMTPQQYGRAVGTTAGQLQLVRGAEEELKMFLSASSLSGSSTKVQVAEAYLTYSQLIDQLGITNVDGTPMNPAQKKKYVYDLLHGKSILDQVATDTANELKPLYGGAQPGSKEGIKNFFNSMSTKADERGGFQQFVSGFGSIFGFHGMTDVVYRDKNINNGKIIGPGEVWSLSEKDRQKLYQDLMSNKAKYARVGADFYDNYDKGKTKDGWHNVGDIVGNPIVGNTKAQSVLIDLTPTAKTFLVPLLGNYTALSNATTRDLSRSGLSSNTQQNTTAATNGFSFGG